MDEQLRRSADFWRGLAVAALVLGVIGSFFIAVGAAQGPYGEGFDGVVFFTILIASLFGLTLSLGLFFMLSRMMEGMAGMLGLLARMTYGSHAVVAGGAQFGTPAPDAGPSRQTRPGRATSSEALIAGSRSSFGSAAWSASHRVPASGAKGWVRPASSLGSIEWVELPGGTELRVEGTSGVWAEVTDREGWTGSVERAVLEPLSNGTIVEPPSLEDDPFEPRKR